MASKTEGWYSPYHQYAPSSIKYTGGTAHHTVFGTCYATGLTNANKFAVLQFAQAPGKTTTLKFTAQGWNEDGNLNVTAEELKFTLTEFGRLNKKATSQCDQMGEEFRPLKE